MKTLSRRIVVVSLLLTYLLVAASSTQAQSIRTGDIAPFEVEFNVGNNLINAGTARLSLRKEAQRWTYTLNTTPKGILKLAGKGKILESSTIQFIESDGFIKMQPTTYLFRQDDERRRAVDARFDWAEQSIEHTYRGNTVLESFEGELYDRLSVTLLIMNALRNDFVNTTLQVFDTGRVKKVAFSNDGTEVLKTPIGRFDTIRVINKNAAGGTRETTTWFAPALDYLPIKIEHRKRSELVARLTLTKLINRAARIGQD